MKSRTVRALEIMGWVSITLLSLIGVAGSFTHLLDMGVHVGDVASFRRTTEGIYGADFTPHWYEFRTVPLVRAAHMAPGLLWMVFTPLQFVGAIRRRMPRFHRWVGRAAVATTLVLIPSGVIFAAFHPFANAFEELAPICFFTVIYLVAVTMGVVTARRKQFVAHREWMIRAFSIGIGISSVRVWFVLFMHTTGMHSQQFFATAFWIAFGFNLLVAETWIALTRRATAQPSAALRPARSPRVKALDAGSPMELAPGGGE